MARAHQTVNARQRRASSQLERAEGQHQRSASQRKGGRPGAYHGRAEGCGRASFQRQKGERRVGRDREAAERRGGGEQHHPVLGLHQEERRRGEGEQLLGRTCARSKSREEHGEQHHEEGAPHQVQHAEVDPLQRRVAEQHRGPQRGHDVFVVAREEAPRPERSGLVQGPREVVDHRVVVVDVRHLHRHRRGEVEVGNHRRQHEQQPEPRRPGRSRTRLHLGELNSRERRHPETVLCYAPPGTTSASTARRSGTGGAGHALRHLARGVPLLAYGGRAAQRHPLEGHCVVRGLPTRGSGRSPGTSRSSRRVGMVWARAIHICSSCSVATRESRLHLRPTAARARGSLRGSSPCELLPLALLPAPRRETRRACSTPGEAARRRNREPRLGPGP